jgi:hypothetical protein
MSKKNILTLEIAEEFLKDAEADLNSLSEFTTIEDAAAKVLAKHKGCLGLRGITTLSKAAASSLAKAAPYCLQFHSLIPSIDVAKQLAKYQGYQICFGLVSVDLPFVKEMAPFRGQLWLGYVSQLDDDVAGELAKRSGGAYFGGSYFNGAYLDGVQEYKDGPGHLALVSALVEWNKDHWLGLRGLKKISQSALAALAEYNGRGLLADSSIKKQILAVKRKQAIAAIKEGKLKEPEEWQNGRIVLSKPPLKPLKGQNRAHTDAGDSSWWLPKTVCKWFEEKLEELHKAKYYVAGTAISPEAAKLLRLKSTEWFWLFEKEKSAEKERARMKLESLATVKAPQEFQGVRVVLPLPKKPLEEVYQSKSDFEGEDYAAVLNFYDYLPEEHRGSVVDSSGYPAKITTPEAADLYRNHRAFWEGKHAEEMAKAKAAAVTRKKTAKENFDKAAASAGLSRKELDAKLNRIGELVEQENLKLAADMIASFGDAWLYEALLAGAVVTAEGDLKPGKVLKRFKSEAKLIMALTMAYMPKGAKVDLSISTDTPIHIKVTGDNIDVVAEMIAPHFPNLKASVESMFSLKKLHELTAEFLVKNEKNLYLSDINTIRHKEAMILSKLEGDLTLDGLKQIDADVANALAQIKGKLNLEGVSSVSETEAMELSRHMGGLALGIKDLKAPIAKALAATRGTLELTGLETISPEAAAALQTHSGELSFGKYEYFSSGKGFDLSVDSARHLARHNGPIVIRELKRVDADAALALSELKHNLALESIKEFPDGVAGVRLCKKMVNSSPDGLALELKRLQPDCAAVLAECRGDLQFLVKDWNDDALLALASYQGRLEINVKQISDAVGLALGQRSAQSSLLIKYASVTLTDGAAEALGNYLGYLSFDEDIELSKEAATHLVKRSRMIVYRSKMKSAIRKIFEAAGSWSDTIWTRNP